MTSATARDQPSEFHPRIESLRGIAALMVALFHSIHLLAVDGIPQVYLRTVWNVRGAQVVATRLLMIFFNGGAAVSLFFVMSGFVLALSLARDRRPVRELSGAFVMRRFFRIYPPLAVNVLLYAAAIWIVCSAWPALYSDPPSPRAIAANLLLVDNGVNGATWSLAVEMLAVPFILVAHLLTRGRSRWLILVPAALALLALNTPRLLFRIRYLYSFVFMFLWGMAVPVIAPPAVGRVSRRSAAVTFWLGVALLLGARFVFGYWSRSSFAVEALGATLLVSVVAYGPDFQALAILDGRAVRFLGRTSYSLYLYHPLFLSLGVSIVMRLLSGTSMPQSYPLVVGLLFALATVPPALLAGELSYRWIERPAVRIGRQVEERIARGTLPADHDRAARRRSYSRSFRSSSTASSTSQSRRSESGEAK